MKKDNRKSKNYSIIIVSDATSANREFSISSKLIRNSVLGFAILMLFCGLMIFDYLTINLDKQKMKRLERETQENQKKMEELATTIESLNKSIKNMEIIKDRIMVAAGLTSPMSLREVGSGGPANEAFGNEAATSIQSPGGFKDAAKLKSAVVSPSDLTQNAQKIEDTLKSVFSVVDQHRLRLASTPSIWPTHGYISAAFSRRINPFTGRLEFHSAMDIATQLGNKVIATADGTILVAETRENYGRMIIIDHGFGWSTRYGHLASFNVREGQRVKRGDIIGFVGSTGRSTGPHLHYEVRFFDKNVNPWDYILDESE